MFRHPRIPKAIILLAWGVLLASLVLPAFVRMETLRIEGVDLSGPRSWTGARAFLFSIFLVEEPQPVYIRLIPLANLWILVSPIFSLRKTPSRRWTASVLVASLFATLVIALSASFPPLSAFNIVTLAQGHYVWVSSFIVSFMGFVLLYFARSAKGAPSQPGSA